MSNDDSVDIRSECSSKGYELGCFELLFRLPNDWNAKMGIDIRRTVAGEVFTSNYAKFILD
jgi:hypothetical protein